MRSCGAGRPACTRMTGTGGGVAHEGELSEDQGKGNHEHGPCSRTVIQTLARPCIRMGHYFSGRMRATHLSKQPVNSNKRPGKIQSEIWINVNLGTSTLLATGERTSFMNTAAPA